MILIQEKIDNILHQGEIYMITCSISNKRYIGQTHSYYKNGLKYGTDRRFKNHLAHSRGENWDKLCRALYSAIRKYGEDSFTCETIAMVHTDKLDDYESKYIKEFNTLSPNGYNLTAGGNGGRRCEETCKKISDGLMGHFISDETRKKISESLSGNKHPNWGKHHSTNTLKKMSIAQSGENHPMYGKTHTAASRERISKTGRTYESDTDLPMYLYRYNSKNNDGYRVTYIDEHGNKKEKTFTDKQLTLQQKLDKALKFHKSKYNTTS